MDQHLQDLAQELTDLHSMTDGEMSEWVGSMTDAQLGALLARIHALTEEEGQTFQVIRQDAAWRVEAGGRVILSSHEKLPAYVPGSGLLSHRGRE